MGSPSISQSLLKEVLKRDHCPKQIFYSFVEGKELLDPSENMLLGRYFESQLLGACRSGEIQEPRYLKGGEKAKPFKDCDELIEFAKEVFANLGLDISKGQSQIDIRVDGLSGAIDHRNIDIENPSRQANYDLKWTATKQDDRWNGWGLPEEKEEAIIQASHYTWISYLETGKWLPFYFLIFGKDKWVKVIKYELTEAQIEFHKGMIADTVSTIKEYYENDYKGNGDFNKCIACPFYDECQDKSKIINIQKVKI